MKDQIIERAVENLKQFGYPDVDKENIFTDEVYSIFFKRMLEDNKGQDKRADAVLDELLSQIKP